MVGSLKAKDLIVAKSSSEIIEDNKYYVLSLSTGVTEIHSGKWIINKIHEEGIEIFSNLVELFNGKMINKLYEEGVDGSNNFVGFLSCLDDELEVYYGIMFEFLPSGIFRFADNIHLLIVQGHKTICIIDDTWYLLYSNLYDIEDAKSLKIINKVGMNKNGDYVRFATAEDLTFYYEGKFSYMAKQRKQDWGLEKLFSGVSIEAIKRRVVLSGVSITSPEFYDFIKERYLDKYITSKLLSF